PSPNVILSGPSLAFASSIASWSVQTSEQLPGPGSPVLSTSSSIAAAPAGMTQARASARVRKQTSFKGNGSESVSGLVLAHQAGPDPVGQRDRAAQRRCEDRHHSDPHGAEAAGPGQLGGEARRDAGEPRKRADEEDDFADPPI